MIACAENESECLVTFKAAFGMHDKADMDAMTIRAEDLLQEGQVKEYRDGVRIKRWTLNLIPGKDVYTDGSAKHLGTP